jgi:four helix bundle protein
MAKGDDIQSRLVKFAVRVLDLCEKLPKTFGGRHIAGQLIRSATSAAPNYAEARGAESKNDFVHKLGITFKELNESEVWLEMLSERRLVPEPELRPIQQECKILCRIIAASRKTAGGLPKRETEQKSESPEDPGLCHNDCP